MERISLDPARAPRFPPRCACCAGPAAHAMGVVARPAPDERVAARRLEVPACALCARHARVAAWCMLPAAVLGLLCGPLGPIALVLLTEGSRRAANPVVLLGAFGFVAALAGAGVFAALTRALGRRTVDCTSGTRPVGAVLEGGALVLVCTSRVFARATAALNVAGEAEGEAGALPAWRAAGPPPLPWRALGGVGAALAVALLAGAGWLGARVGVDATRRALAPVDEAHGLADLALVAGRFEAVERHLQRAAAGLEAARVDLAGWARLGGLSPATGPLAAAGARADALRAEVARGREASDAALAALHRGLEGGGLVAGRAAAEATLGGVAPDAPARRAVANVVVALERGDAGRALEAIDEATGGARGAALAASVRLAALRPALEQAGLAPDDERAQGAGLSLSSPPAALRRRLDAVLRALEADDAGAARAALEALAAELPPGAAELAPLARRLEEVQARAVDVAAWTARGPTLAREALALHDGVAARPDDGALRLEGAGVVVLEASGALAQAHAALPAALRARADAARYVVLVVRATHERPVALRLSRSATEDVLGRIPGQSPAPVVEGVEFTVEVVAARWPERVPLGARAIVCPPPTWIPLDRAGRVPDPSLLRGDPVGGVFAWVLGLAR